MVDPAGIGTRFLTVSTFPVIYSSIFVVYRFSSSSFRFPVYCKTAFAVKPFLYISFSIFCPRMFPPSVVLSWSRTLRPVTPSNETEVRKCIMLSCGILTVSPLFGLWKRYQIAPFFLFQIPLSSQYISTLSGGRHHRFVFLPAPVIHT